MPDRAREILFPTGGLNRSMAIQSQPPYTTPDCKNVRPDEIIESRGRGGSRPGLVGAFAGGKAAKGASDYPNMIAVTRSVVTSGARFYDYTPPTDATAFPASLVLLPPTTSTWALVPFDGAIVPRGWQPTNDNDAAFVTDLTNAGGNYVDISGVDELQGRSITLDIDLELNKVNGSGDAQMMVSVWCFLDLDSSSPYATTDSMYLNWYAVAAAGGFDEIQHFLVLYRYASGSLVQQSVVAMNDLQVNESPYFRGRRRMFLGYTPSSATAGTITATFGRFGDEAGDYNYGAATLGVTGYTLPGIRPGFAGVVANGQNAFGFKINSVYFQYGSQSSDSSNTSVFVGLGGLVYRSDDQGALAQVDSNTVAGDKPGEINDTLIVRAVELFGDLFIADHGDVFVSGVGTINASDQLTDSTVGLDYTTYVTPEKQAFVVEIINGTDVVAGFYNITALAAGQLTLSGGGGSGASACSYRIVPKAKYYDIETAQLNKWEATNGGTYPYNCEIIARWNGRIVLAGNPTSPQSWYMSRQYDPLDFDYSQPVGDTTRAMIGTSTEAGVIADRITAIAPGPADLLVFGCDTSLWVMRGDPARGGRVDNLSMTVGIASPDAWCWDEGGRMFFIGREGLYVWSMGSYPQHVSERVIPAELQRNSFNDNIQLEFDPEEEGIHIFINRESGDRVYYWVDLDGGGFWPVSFDSADHYVNVARLIDFDLISRQSVLLGCEDGVVRRFDGGSTDDDGTDIESEVVLGPFMLGDVYNAGMIEEISAALDTSSEPVSYSIGVADTAEDAITNSNFDGTFVSGRSYKEHPNLYGKYCAIRVKGGVTTESGLLLGEGDGLVVQGDDLGSGIWVTGPIEAGIGWAMESVLVGTRRYGEHRVL